MVKILIVEDNFFLQKALEEKLSNFSDIVIKDTAQNGEEAIAILEKNHVVDLILMDIEMPIMNGIKATEIIKSNYPQIKIIMITVFDNDDNVFNAIKAGADGRNQGGKNLRSYKGNLSWWRCNVSFNCIENTAIVKKSKSF